MIHDNNIRKAILKHNTMRYYFIYVCRKGLVPLKTLNKLLYTRRLIEWFISAKSCSDATQIASTYLGLGFRVDLGTLEKAGLGGAPVVIGNPLTSTEAGTREFRFEVS